MKTHLLKQTLAFVIVLTLIHGALTAIAQNPLPSWNDGPAKRAIIDFVAKVTTAGSPDFVPVAERIATFDNDGTLWCEQPMYVQVVFALDQVKALAPRHPEWKDKEPFKSILAGDIKGALASGEKGLLEIMAVTHAGMTTAEFEKTVLAWVTTAEHPRFQRPYTQCVYQPMLEVLAYLRENGFKTFIVSGGGIEFMRPWTENTYGVPPEQVVGSCGQLKYEVRDGKPVILKLPAVDFIDDHAGKPVGIQRFIGRQPILAFGNSDGDFEMLEWTTADKPAAPPARPTQRPRPRLGLLVHHTDAVREYAYDRDSKIGQLQRGLDEAKPRGWIVVDMKNDWKQVFPFD